MEQEFDRLITTIADYVVDGKINNEDAYHTARLCLFDALGCGFLAMRYPECERLLGPLVGGEIIEDGVRVPGTHYELTPVEAAFNMGTMIRWLDYNDTWLAKEWGHPSDNIGGILAVADYISRLRKDSGGVPLSMEEVLTAIIKAYEIQGVLALENSFNSIGIDHVILVKIATTAVVTGLAGGTKQQVANAISLAFVDGHPMRTYRHGANTGSRKSWAAGDATSRGVWLAQMALRGEMGIPTVLSAEKWGFYDVYLHGEPLILNREFDSYVMENILFKVNFPAEFHGQTAVEAALKLFDQVNLKWDKITRIEIRTQDPAVQIIDKTGELHNSADRDHCLQYMIAVALIWGELRADHYTDQFARDPRIDKLREKMHVESDEAFTEAYYDPARRAIPNAIQIFFEDGTQTEEVVVEYPLGHQRRREEALPFIEQKFHNSAMTHFKPEVYTKLNELFSDHKKFIGTSVTDFMALMVK